MYNALYIVHHNPFFNLFMLHSNPFDNQGSEINKNEIFYNIISYIYNIYIYYIILFDIVFIPSSLFLYKVKKFLKRFYLKGYDLWLNNDKH